MQTTERLDSNTTLARTLLVAGEALVPGASNIVAGNIGTGLGHLVATGVAVAVLAPTMPFLAAVTAIGLRVNSYKLATTGSSLMNTVAESLPQAKAAKAS